MIKAQVVTACSIDGAQKKPGDNVEVDQNTFDNLVLKGVLKAADVKAEKAVAAPVAVEAPKPIHHKKHSRR